MSTGNSKVSKANVSFLVLLLALLLFSLMQTEAQIGLSYGQNGDNLPSPQQVVNLYRTNGIQWMRIYYPDQATLQAISGSGVNLLLDVPNDQIQNFAQNPSAAGDWVQKNVVPYAESIYYLAVGNEVPQNIRQYVGPAMTNTRNALNSFSSASHIKVTTAISTTDVNNTFPPSDGQFKDLTFMNPILNFLRQNGSPLMVNVYPYFAYILTGNVPLDYVLFTLRGIRFIDNGLIYQNVYDALVDSVYAAIAKVGEQNNQGGPPHTQIITSETGWPSAGGDSGSPPNNGDAIASLANAEIYYRNMISHAKNGTPLKPGPSQVFLFAAFDEDKKQGAATEQHFGIFHTDGTPKYSGLNFN